jgi:ABC-type sugar transport system substrate-binding protein
MPAANTVPKHSIESIKPPTRFAAITPSDSVDLEAVTRAIHVGEAGDLAVVGAEGDEVIFKGLAAGTVKVGSFRRVKATGTSAASLIAEW